MPLARDVLHQVGIPGAEDFLGAVFKADLELAGEDDNELAPRCRMLSALKGAAYVGATEHAYSMAILYAVGNSLGAGCGVPSADAQAEAGQGFR